MSTECRTSVFCDANKLYYQSWATGPVRSHSEAVLSSDKKIKVHAESLKNTTK